MNEESNVKTLTPKSVSNQEVENRKPTYEELSEMVSQLTEKCNALYGRCLQYENLLNMKRLDYLFEVLKYKDSFDMEFLKKCVEEIQDMMTIPEENSEEK